MGIGVLGIEERLGCYYWGGISEVGLRGSGEHVGEVKFEGVG